jgi:hypothetical protein
VARRRWPAASMRTGCEFRWDEQYIWARSSSSSGYVMSEMGRVSRAPHELSVARNCTRDEGGPIEFGDQEPISSHRKLLRAKAVVVSVAETPEQDFGRHRRERRAQANRCRSVESGLGDVRTGG